MDPGVLGLPLATTIELEGVEFLVTHETGPEHNYERRVAEILTDERSDPSAVGVSGHTHSVLDDTVSGARLLNPGSATGVEPAEEVTMLRATVSAGNLDVEQLQDRAGEWWAGEEHIIYHRSRNGECRMQIEFQHANPHSGRESVLLRFEGLLPNQTVCVLVDAGQNVSTDQLLDQDANEYLSAICLTHAHLDHYHSLGDTLEHAAPIYAATDTASILEDVFAAGADHYDITNTEAVLTQLEGIGGWTQIVSGLQVRPLPAGHTPGAASFLFEATDGDDHRTVLVTGDFTTRRAAGYPGFDPELPAEVDVLVLNAASSDEFESTLTDAVATITERVRDGSTVLATASGLTGLHVAYLLGHLSESIEETIPITLTGHVGKLYDRLDYTVPQVDLRPEFADPTSVLDSGSVTIAGPEVPVDGSSKRLFETISDDFGATLVQLTNGGGSPVSTGSCTTHQFSLSNHPTEATLDSVVESLSPVHVVVTHQQGPAADQFKDKYDSYVWATDDTKCYTLLDESGWTAPPWVTESTKRRVQSGNAANGQLLRTAVADLDTHLGSVEPVSTVDLGAEGLDMERLAERLPAQRQPELRTGEQRPDSAETGSETADSAGSPQETKQKTEAEPATSEAALQTIDSRLERLESALSSPELDAHVVDAGDGTLLLRLENPPPSLDHGDSVRVRLSTEYGTAEPE